MKMFDILPNWHPIFVHFTVALFSVATGLYAVSLFTANEQLKSQWRMVARWNLWFGMVFTLFTLLTGWYAYNTVSHDEPSHLAMTEHRNWALVTVALYFIATVWSIARHRTGNEASPLLLLFLVVTLSSMGSTAWRGGEVVYRYGLGVMSLPNTGRHAHSAQNESHGYLPMAKESGRAHADGDTEMPHSESGVEGGNGRMDASPLVKQGGSEMGHHDSTPHTH